MTELIPSVSTPRPPITRRRTRAVWWLPCAVVVLVVLCVVSMFVGVYDTPLSGIIHDPDTREVFFLSRTPRTLALVLSAGAMGVAGLIMQLISRNKFVEPSTTGVTQSASLGILAMTILWPGAPIPVRVAASCAAAFVGSLIFVAVIRRVTGLGEYAVPLLGIMTGAVIGAVATFLALKYNLSQMLVIWETGSFSNVIQGRYEFLWITAILTGLALIMADRLTVLGLGEDTARGLGINSNRVLLSASLIVAAICGVVVSVVGALPFVGIIVPNLVSATLGDNARPGLPWVWCLSAILVIICDIVGRTIRMPYEIPVGSVLGVLGAAVLVGIILWRFREERQ